VCGALDVRQFKPRGVSRAVVEWTRAMPAQAIDGELWCRTRHPRHGELLPRLPDDHVDDQLDVVHRARRDDDEQHDDEQHDDEQHDDDAAAVRRHLPRVLGELPARPAVHGQWSRRAVRLYPVSRPPAS